MIAGLRGVGLIVLALLAAPALAEPERCEIGAWRLSDGRVVDIAPTDGGLRWRLFDGTTGKLTRTGDAWTSTRGWTDHPDGVTASFEACASDHIGFGGLPGRRIPLDVTNSKFHGDGVELAGRLVMPIGPRPVPIVVLVHGSEDYSALEFYSLQRQLPAEGVGVFVYDKRGTGASGGVYTQDFDILANDAVAAMREARRLAGGRAGRIGYFGSSQGGWVAPMAANRAPVDFVIVGYGLAVSPLEENRSEMKLEMRLAGHGPKEIAKAMEVVKAGETLILSGLTKGFEAFAAVKAKYAQAPWYKDLHGNYTYLLLPLDTEGLKANRSSFVLGTPWRYDPMPALRAARTPQLWLLGDDDLLAPSAETSKRIRRLGASGHPFTLAMFPHAGHGIMEYETDAKGVRAETRVAEGYNAMIRDFAREGALTEGYGAATITQPARR